MNDAKNQILDHHIHVLQFLKPEHLDINGGLHGRGVQAQPTSHIRTSSGL